MSILTQLVQKSIENLLNLDISEGVGEFIEGGMEIMTGFLCDLVKCRLEEMDDFIFENSEARKDWKVVQKGRKRSILTKAGEVTYSRRYYENKEIGLKAYLVDALAGIEKFSKIETEYALELIRNAAEMSYEKAGKSRDTAQVSKTAVMNKTRQAEDYRLPVEECNLSVKCVHIQADEDHIHMAEGSSAIAKIAVIYSEKKALTRTRNLLVDKRICTSFDENNTDFWYRIQDAIHEKYGVRDDLKVYIHGDGANWIKTGLQVIPNSEPVLDTFHLKRKLNGICGGKYSGTLCSLIAANKFRQIRILLDTLVAGGETTEQDAKDLYMYLNQNRLGAVNAFKPGIGSSCAEGLVSHNLSERFSRKPCGWGKKGLSTILSLRTFYLNKGELSPENMLHSGEVVADIESMRREYHAKCFYEPEHNVNITALTPDAHKLTWLKKIARNFSL